MLDLSTALVFALALALIACMPGPSIAAMVSRVITKGWQDVIPFVAAMWIGEVIWMTLAVAGLATVAETFAVAFTVIKYCGIAYLVYLAWQMWTTAVDAPEVRHAPQTSSRVKMFLAGFSVTMGNPKIVVFYMALLPTLIDLEGITVAGWAVLCIITLSVLAVIDLSYIALASRARGYLKSPRAVRLTNRVGATMLGGAAAVIAAKS